MDKVLGTLTANIASSLPYTPHFLQPFFNNFSKLISPTLQPAPQYSFMP